MAVSERRRRHCTFDKSITLKKLLLLIFLCIVVQDYPEPRDIINFAKHVMIFNRESTSNCKITTKLRCRTGSFTCIKEQTVRLFSYEQYIYR